LKRLLPRQQRQQKKKKSLSGNVRLNQSIVAIAEKNLER
jgi:hypothetical protein